MGTHTGLDSWDRLQAAGNSSRAQGCRLRNTAVKNWSQDRLLLLITTVAVKMPIRGGNSPLGRSSSQGGWVGEQHQYALFIKYNLPFVRETPVIGQLLILRHVSLVNTRMRTILHRAPSSRQGLIPPRPKPSKTDPDILFSFANNIQ